MMMPGIITKRFLDLRNRITGIVQDVLNTDLIHKHQPIGIGCVPRIVAPRTAPGIATALASSTATVRTTAFGALRLA